MYIFVERELSTNKSYLRCISNTKLNIHLIKEKLKDIISFDFTNYTERFIGKYTYTFELNYFKEINKDDFICDIKNKSLYDKYCNLSYKQNTIDEQKYKNDLQVPFIIKYFYNKELICNVKNYNIMFEYMEV